MPSIFPITSKVGRFWEIPAEDGWLPGLSSRSKGAIDAGAVEEVVHDDERSRLEGLGRASTAIEVSFSS